jgi:hypothetical protein
MKFICYLFGHDVVGPRRGDGKVICWRCHANLQEGKFDHLSEEDKLINFCKRELEK